MNNFGYRRSYRGCIQLAVFDWAGTTVDYGCCAPAAVFIEGYRRKGITISLAQARGPMGREKRAHLAAIGAMDEVAAQWQRVHGRAITDQDIDELYADFAPLLLQTLAAHAALIPGVLSTMAYLRRAGIKIGATTGYFTDAAAAVASAAAHQGYQPDSLICASEVPAGRPAPWMIYRTMERCSVYPPEAVVSVGDTPVDVASALNAGVWAVAVAKTGNEMGLNATELAALPADVLHRRLQEAHTRLAQAGAHYVVDGVWGLPAVVEEINARLARGERP